MKPTCVFAAALAAVLLSSADAGAQRRSRKGAGRPTPAPAKVQAPPEEPKKEAPAKEENKEVPPEKIVTPSALRGPTRIDFDDRLVQGQTNKLGAVYLYQRKDPAQGSLLERRKSFREEIVKDVVE
jgi:hypothetical protein